MLHFYVREQTIKNRGEHRKIELTLQDNLNVFNKQRTWQPKRSTARSKQVLHINI